MNPSSGRFLSLDSFEGSISDPASLHKYLYANADPANKIDPSGKVSIAEFVVVAAVATIIAAMSISCANPVKVEEGPKFELLLNSTQKDSVFVKHFQLKIHGRDAGNRFLVVQWVRGYAKKDGNYLNRDPRMCKFGEANIPNWEIDNDCTGLARYSEVTSISNALILVDRPGVESPQSGSIYEENVEFIVAVYDAKAYPVTTPAERFRTPTDPAPLASYPWEFKDKYQVP